MLRTEGFLDWHCLDGCHNGWIGCIIENTDYQFDYIPQLDSLKSSPIKKIYIDMPVKLPKSLEDFPRKADVNAKKILGRHHASIFYAPLPSWLNQDYHQINKTCEEFQKPKLSKQSFNLFPKIQEVQAFRAKSTLSIQEIHPELLAHHFLGTSKKSKKSPAGISQRLAILAQPFRIKISLEDLQQDAQRLQNKYPAARFKLDDLIDALFSAAVIYHQNSLEKELLAFSGQGLSQKIRHFF